MKTRLELPCKKLSKNSTIHAEYDSAVRRSFGRRLWGFLLLLFITVQEINQLLLTALVTGGRANKEEEVLAFEEGVVLHNKSIVRKKNNTSTTTTSSRRRRSISEIIQKNNEDPRKVVVAYAVSYIQCNKDSDYSTLRDAALVLRHSIHKIHQQSNDYSYKMYAFIHRQAQNCSKQFDDIGFHSIIVDPLVQTSEIQDDYLREHIREDGCCGDAELIKLNAYSLPEEEVVVHMDMDFVFLKPIDHLFDAILYDKDHPKGIAARNKIELETPSDGFPDKIGAFWTRTWGQVVPNEFPAGFQGGFLVARRDPSVIDELVTIIKEERYLPGRGKKAGWGGTGHGGYTGAMSVQGVLAYYYDYVRTNEAVELNQCRYNHMGMDVRYRTRPNFRPGSPHVGKCRNIMKDDECEDCKTTNVSLIYNVHYTNCRKPWQCMATGNSRAIGPHGGFATAINTDAMDFDHCMELLRHWHEMRTDFEEKLHQLTKDGSIKRDGSYRPDLFNGHCSDDGTKYYLPIGGSSKTFDRIKDMY